MPMRIMLLALVLAGCPAAGSRPASAPDPNETPPTTADPGASEDQRPLPPSTPPPPETGTTTTGEPAGPRPDGASCLQGADCTSGICEGEGCGEAVPGKCMPRARACTRDLRSYCGCDGKTFQSSGSCPGQRYASRGQCTGS